MAIIKNKTVATTEQSQKVFINITSEKGNVVYSTMLVAKEENEYNKKYLPNCRLVEDYLLSTHNTQKYALEVIARKGNNHAWINIFIIDDDGDRIQLIANTLPEKANDFNSRWFENSSKLRSAVLNGRKTGALTASFHIAGLPAKTVKLS